MAEDLLDFWVRLITPIFPTNAWIVSRFSKNNHIIQIDWRLGNDPQKPGKRSKTIEITIKEDAIEDYLDKNKLDRELYGILLKNFICERYNHFDPDIDARTSQYIPVEKWLISKDALNTLPPSHNVYHLES
jgi:hypothetical protein